MPFFPTVLYLVTTPALDSRERKLQSVLVLMRVTISGNNHIKLPDTSATVCTFLTYGATEAQVLHNQPSSVPLDTTRACKTKPCGFRQLSFIQSEVSPASLQKSKNYTCEITYDTNNPQRCSAHTRLTENSWNSCQHCLTHPHQTMPWFYLGR